MRGESKVMGIDIFGYWREELRDSNEEKLEFVIDVAINMMRKKRRQKNNEYYRMKSKNKKLEAENKELKRANEKDKKKEEDKRGQKASYYRYSRYELYQLIGELIEENKELCIKNKEIYKGTQKYSEMEL